MFNIIKRHIFIKNINFNLCKTCIYFMEDRTNYPYNPVPNNEKYGKCKLFGEQNLVSGEIQHDYAVWCRQDNTKCGKDGNYYTDKRN